MITVYHGSDYLFNKFHFKNVGKKSGTSGAGFGLYFSTSKIDAMCYGKYMYTCELQLQKPLDNNKVTLSTEMLRVILEAFESISPTSYIENWNGSYGAAIKNLKQRSKTDTEIIGDIINATDEIIPMMNVLVKYGFTHSIDIDTPEDKTITNYVVYDLNCVRIIKREKSIDDLTESYIQEEIFESGPETRIVVSNIPQALVSLGDTMEREAKTRTLSQAQGKAKSKSQRRLMAMALAYKRGKLPEKYASDSIKKLSKTIDQEGLHDFAKTNQKKRRKDGSVGKRNNIPYKVKKK